MRIPAAWQAEIDAGTAFGARVSAAKNRKAQSPRGRRVATTTRKQAAKSPEPVGDALKARIESLVTIKTGKSCGCENLATQMNQWGIAGCEKRREEIISHLVGNRDVLLASLRSIDGWIGLASEWAASMVPEFLLRKGAGWLLDEAIEKVRVDIINQKEERRRRGVPRPQRKSKVYSGWRSEADGPMIPMGPFESKIRHLTYFVYPRNEESWKWNLQQLAKRWWLFNGTRVLGVAHDAMSASAADVTNYAEELGMKFDHVLTAVNNAKLRETVLWVPMLRLLNPTTAGANEVVFSAHAKGQKYDDAKFTRDWCDLMYQSCLDDWPSVYNALRTALMAGSFREYGLLGRWHNWAYSGTFFWWRLAELAKRPWSNVDQWFAGTESWPGKMCEARETACLFLNDSRRLYEKHYWIETVWPEWEKYKRKMHVSNND